MAGGLGGDTEKKCAEALVEFASKGFEKYYVFIQKKPQGNDIVVNVTYDCPSNKLRFPMSLEPRMLKKVLAHRKSGQMYQHLADILYPLINFPIKNWFAEVQANPDFKLTITQKLLAALHEFVGTPQKSAGLAGGGSAAAAGRGRKRRREAVACEDEAYRTVAPLRAVLAAPVADPGVAAPTISPK